ncbi:MULTISPECIES: SRPBCC domain-containing protein [Methylococcus]|uniref:SRPBCC domain-containing protein n=1 Tax=Methylococcus capsulatus TaxID=414 RepID=A0ABZ2F6G5_METCP|nr:MULTISPECIES: SRPBCC domain-containing protein [Methylococcus]MDF9392987.1 activator of HSP90 ATPase [Methylococcus capsulatus]
MPENATPITIDAFVPVSPAGAWAAYTAPEAITQWNQASPDWHCPWVRVDLRVGGRHVARMEARDGSMGFEYEGTYEAMDAPSALTLRLDDGRRVHTTFISKGAGTRVTTTFDPEGTHPIDLQRLGWQAIFDRYAAFAATAG